MKTLRGKAHLEVKEYRIINVVSMIHIYFLVNLSHRSGGVDWGTCARSLKHFFKNVVNGVYFFIPKLTGVRGLSFIR